MLDFYTKHDCPDNKYESRENILRTSRNILRKSTVKIHKKIENRFNENNRILRGRNN